MPQDCPGCGDAPPDRPCQRPAEGPAKLDGTGTGLTDATDADRSADATPSRCRRRRDGSARRGGSQAVENLGTTCGNRLGTLEKTSKITLPTTWMLLRTDRPGPGQGNGRHSPKRCLRRGGHGAFGTHHAHEEQPRRSCHPGRSCARPDTLRLRRCITDGDLPAERAEELGNLGLTSRTLTVLNF